MADIKKIKMPDNTTYDLRDSNLNGHTVNADVPSNAVFTDTTYNVMTGATSSTDGTSGLVPAPSSSGYNIKYLRADGSWATPAPKVKVIDYTITMLAEDESFIETITDSEITSNHFVVSSTIDPPACQASNWMVQCTSGELEIEGLVYPEDEDFDIDITLILAEGNNSESVATSIIEAPFYSDTTHYLVDKSKNGLCPKLPNETTTTKFLRQDRTWSVPDYPITGIKGDAESTYRTGNINLTSANIGALALTGGNITGSLNVTETISAGAVISTPYLAVDNPSEDTSGVTASLQVGNEIAVGTIGNSVGEIRLYGTRDKCTKLVSNVTFADFEVAFPNKGGTVAMVSDITATQAGALPTTGGTLTGALTLSGYDLELKTTSSSSNDSSDITFFYGNGQEKSRIWTDSTYTIAKGPNYRVYKEDGTSLYSGSLVIRSQLTDGSVTKVGTGTVGGASQSIYLNAGTPTAGNSFVPTTGGTFSGNVTINNATGTANADAWSRLYLGNATAYSSAGHSEGAIYLYGKTGYTTNIIAPNSTAARGLTCPDKSGTIACTNDITAANAGALALTGGTTSGNITILTTSGNRILSLGSSTASSYYGVVMMYGKNGKAASLYPYGSTDGNRGAGSDADVRVRLPNSSGLMALTSSSARRYKKDISYDINASLDPHKLLDLPMAQFKYREGADLQYFDMDNLLIDGFIAEDVNTHYPAAVIHNSAGEIESWDERRLLPPMLALIQELYTTIDELTSRIEQLENK